MIASVGECPLYLPTDFLADPPHGVQELKHFLERGTDAEKIKALEDIICILANESSGASINTEVLMHIIRFVLPSQKNKQIKKLLLLYFELCPKLGEDGRLLQEMILVCNALRNDLQHPNEFVRGFTLRFVAKIKEQEILEPLVQSIRSNLVFTCCGFSSFSRIPIHMCEEMRS